ncbi:hypothetical protein VNI00_018965 [Paramarasmius palmivorus]|uniref:DUF6535 domain-containing protein n=1 Tax=Paramarasmius palmivorus TaxID=297713 RepID=A0AAW0AS15_9AGAR
MSDMVPFQGPSNGLGENTEEERMRKGYEQLEKDLRKERWEERKRKREGEQNMMEMERKRMEEERRKIEEVGQRIEAETRSRRMRRRILSREDEDIRSKPQEEWEKEEDKEWRRKWREKEKKEREEKKEERRRKEKEAERKKEAADRAYEKLQVEVKKYDDGMVLGWKEDIDTLLVFAGLFSAVVTAFLIESYQWLSEDASVALLTQISQQLNGTQTQSTPFTPDASSIRINCFWFLSLIFSLTSALFGLLCKQWLREHQRDVPTRTAAENLALRQLRRDSFEKWGVASFLSALPILLEIALVFFFAGVLDLLWTLQPIVFSICLAAISLSIGLYFLTTILPTITIPRDQARFINTWDDESQRVRHDFGQLAYQFICPYKSPQAWAVYKLFTTLPKPLLRFPFINKFTRTHLCPLWDHIQAQTSSWSTFDLQVVRQFDEQVYTLLDSFQLPVYELRALQWAVTMFRDSPSMIPHLENVLETLPRSVAISAVLDQWDIVMWEGWEQDIGEYLRYPTMSMPEPITSDPPLHSREGIELLFWHRLWGVFVEHGDVVHLSYYLEDFTQKFPKSSRNLQFYIPLSFATALWSREGSWVRQESLLLLRHFEGSWKPSSGYDEERHNEERVAFANGLAAHINHSDPPSVLLTRKRGQAFIRFIHHDIIIRRLYSRDDFWRYDWQDAIQKVQGVGKLPVNHFAPLPRRDEDPPPSSQLPQLEPIRYSQHTVDPQPDSPRDEDGERPPSPAGNVENIEIQVHGSQNDTTGEIPELADGTLLPGSTNPGDSGSPAPNENDALPPDSNEPHMSRRTVAEGTNPGDSEVQVTASNSVAEGPSTRISPSAGDESTVLGEGILDIDPDHFAQATVDGAQVASLSFERQGGPAAVDHRAQGIVDTEGTAADSGQDTHTVSDNISLAILEPPDLRVTSTNSLRQGDGVGGDGVSGRIGWNPTNDPNLLRVHWFRP